jgi:glucosamine--fructose-6-phosphate aminotransferase (isomerizing)
VRLALGEVVGAYAVLVLDVPTGELVAARRSSPLAVGIGDFEVFIASDAIPIVEHVRDIIYLDDGDIAQIKPRGPNEIPDVKLFNLAAEGPVERPVVRVELKVEELGRDGHETFMMKEVYEQPLTVRDCLRGRLTPGDGPIALGGLETAWPGLLRARHIRIVACGTSWHAGLIGKHLIETLTRIPCEVDYASEFRYRDPIVGPGDVVLAISQSGETADTRAALELALQRGATPVGVVNVVGSSISRLAGCGIYTRSGVEIGVASTKAFTGQVTALALLALGMAHSLGTLDRDAYEELKAELDTVPDKIAEVLDKEASKADEPWKRTLLDLLADGARRHGPEGFKLAQSAVERMLDGDDKDIRKVTKNLLIASNLLAQLQNAEADRKERAREWLRAIGQTLGTILKAMVGAVL